MLRCCRCAHEGARSDFESKDSNKGYVCPNCGMDESGIIAYCEVCGVESDDTTLSDSIHTNPLCFK